MQAWHMEARSCQYCVSAGVSEPRPARVASRALLMRDGDGIDTFAFGVEFTPDECHTRE
jgi:hypothetical protein